MNLFLDAALRYAEHGWKVFALARGSKIPRKGTKGHLDATTDATFLREWWHETPFANIGLSCAANNLIVIDKDRRDGKDGLSFFEKLEGYEPLPPTVAAITGSDALGIGSHEYFILPQGLKFHSNLGELSGVDIKANGFVLLEPSVLKNGKRYVWQEGCSLLERAIAPLPDWLIPHVSKPIEPPRNSTPTEPLILFGSFEEQRVINALNYIDPDISYPDWLKITLGIKASGCGYPVYRDWCARSTKFSETVCQSKWRESPKNITVATVFHYARENPAFIDLVNPDNHRIEIRKLERLETNNPKPESINSNQTSEPAPPPYSDIALKEQFVAAHGHRLRCAETKWMVDTGRNSSASENGRERRYYGQQILKMDPRQLMALEATVAQTSGSGGSGKGALSATNLANALQRSMPGILGSGVLRGNSAWSAAVMGFRTSAGLVR